MLYMPTYTGCSTKVRYTSALYSLGNIERKIFISRWAQFSTANGAITYCGVNTETKKQISLFYQLHKNCILLVNNLFSTCKLYWYNICARNIIN
jgi:hypothetical protein